MTERFATTPFGGGRISASSFLRREEIDQRRRQIKSARGSNDTGSAEKWQLLRALTEARAAFNLSDRTITVLEALLSFHPARELDGSQPIIVFPSNAELSLRSRGMADATLRRHLAALVEAGLILRCDSPNGKRYVRRDERGEVECAFGFDLSPLALAAPSIHSAAEEARALARRCQTVRTEISIHLRDTGKIIDAALAEGFAGEWQHFALRLMPLGRRLARQAPLEALEARRDDLVRLRAEVEKAYLDALSEQKVSGNDNDSERHYQNSNTDHNIEIRSEKELKPEPVPRKVEPEGGLSGEADGKATRSPETRSEPVPLGYVLAVCPAIAAYARGGIAGWPDLMRTVELVRSMLGISPDAWRRARQSMGHAAAAVTLAAILEKADTIRSPGGYLRALTDRAEQGKFSVRPMLAALEKGAGTGD